MVGNPDTNLQVILTSRPSGVPQPEHFEMNEAEMPQPADRQILVKNMYLSVDAAQRGWAADRTNYIEPVPIGGVMRALGVGEIIESKHPELQVGTFVYGWLGWQEYSVIGQDEILTHIVSPKYALSAYLGVLGINGLTAYFALSELAAMEPGQTICVTTAAGAVGSIVGQLAKAQGLQVVGLTGSDEKVELCQTRFGYDALRNYKSGDIAAHIEEMAPNGVDIFFDQVGGRTLDVILTKMNNGGRIIQCGTAANQVWDPQPIGVRLEREVLMRRLRWSGFVIFDYKSRFAEGVRELEKCIGDDSLCYREQILEGLPQAKTALVKLYSGENLGKLCIRVNRDFD